MGHPGGRCKGAFIGKGRLRAGTNKLTLGDPSFARRARRRPLGGAQDVAENRDLGIEEDGRRDFQRRVNTT